MSDKLQIFLMAISILAMMASCFLFIKARRSLMKELFRDIAGWLTILALMLWMLVT